jgi:hypothetical protein
MFSLDSAVVMPAVQSNQGMNMSISLFGYTLLAGVVVLAAYLASVSSVEPPLELYTPTVEGEEQLAGKED